MVDLYADNRAHMPLRPMSDHVQARVLAAGVGGLITVPAGAQYVIFSCTVNFYCRSTTAAVPAADITDGSAAELNPAGYHVSAGDVLAVISPEAGVLTAAFYE